MTYRLKFRFWFQDYNNHKNLERFYYQTEAYAGEYDVPKCQVETPPEECIHSITAHFQGRDMIDNNKIIGTSGFKLIYLPRRTCIDMELYNADTGDLICHVDGQLGKGYAAIRRAYQILVYLEKIRRYHPTFSDGIRLTRKREIIQMHIMEKCAWQMRGVIV